MLRHHTTSKRTAGVLAALALVGASGCATLAPSEPCTADWFDYQRQEAFAPVRSELSRALDRMRSAQQSLQSSESASLGAMFDLAFALEGGLRVIEVTEQQAMPQLQAAARQCNDNGFVRRAMLEFLEDEGVDDLFSSGGALAGLGPALDAMLTDGMADLTVGL